MITEMTTPAAALEQAATDRDRGADAESDRIRAGFNDSVAKIRAQGYRSSVENEQIAERQVKATEAIAKLKSQYEAERPGRDLRAGPEGSVAAGESSAGIPRGPFTRQRPGGGSCDLGGVGRWRLGDGASDRQGRDRPGLVGNPDGMVNDPG